jgi:hypothetical protein
MSMSVYMSHICLTECRTSTIEEVIGEVEVLFKGHEELLVQFNDILVQYYGDDTDTAPLEVLESLGFLSKLKVHILKSEMPGLLHTQLLIYLINSGLFYRNVTLMSQRSKTPSEVSWHHSKAALLVLLRRTMRYSL